MTSQPRALSKKRNKLKKQKKKKKKKMMMKKGRRRRKRRKRRIKKKKKKKKKNNPNEQRAGTHAIHCGSKWRHLHPHRIESDPIASAEPEMGRNRHFRPRHLHS